MKYSTALCGIALAAVAQAADCIPVYKNPNATVEDRVNDLLRRMTVEEKTSQLIQGDIRDYLDLETGRVNQTGLEWVMERRSHAIWTGLYAEPEVLKEGARIAQEYLTQETRLGIPTFIQSEGLHGFLAVNATIFNSPIAIGCAFNRRLVEQMANAIADEARALGVNQLFSPVVDLAREQRFGRVEETFGEDAYLAGELGYHFAKGLQDGGVSAQVKHFAAFGTPEQGINTGPVHGGERELRRLYLPPFKRAIMDSGAWSVMSSYNSYDGVPTVADHHLLTDILRNEWGYEYFVISDAGGTARVADAFSICARDDNECITTEVLTAGNDVEMGGGRYSFEVIPEMIESGSLDEEVLNTAVARVLRVKFEMGLFEEPFSGVPDDEIWDHINTPEHRQLARDLDAESIVLLENHDNILPLSKDANVAVIGPMGHGYVNYGDYVIYRSQYRGVTPFDGIEAASEGTVTFTQGCERWSNDESGFAEAIAAAEAADVAVVVVGTWSRDQNELWAGLNATTGEHVDVHDLKLVGAMPRLVRAIIDTGKPTVVVYSSGKPITEPWISEDAAALVQQFYQSEEGGHALADVLYGDVNPSGKLSVSFPYDVGTLPIYYDHLRSGRTYPDPGRVYPNGTMVFGHNYVLENPLPLYPFGYGQSYSTFEYSNVRASATSLSADDTVTISVDVTNESDHDGAQVVQIYVRDELASVDLPRHVLKGFDKVFIEAGETTTVEVELSVQEWGLWNRRMEYVVEPGEFTILVGTDSETFVGEVTVTVA
ncbi:hypothetical protein S40285_07600 [Stachybotrys chlorohalonatus IBT 40285]|uniref:beta-glucosidase n=1 Tax=Stachybotrys chlorohalonatus (strain IBT 40285) TaxID=1283841 RepID=A0A084QDE5_STAC4|nr:hypothetical protein S40285_07600 [Stachybotrys chlorohalonata IBT 40285]